MVGQSNIVFMCQFYHIKLSKNSFKAHRCPICYIDALPMPFSMRDEIRHRYRYQAMIIDAQWHPCVCKMCSVCNASSAVQSSTCCRSDTDLPICGPSSDPLLYRPCRELYQWPSESTWCRSGELTFPYNVPMPMSICRRTFRRDFIY